QKRELEYRKKQLESLKDNVIDIEDMEGGISISDLTFNDFKVDADRTSAEDKQRYQFFGTGVFSLVKNNIEEQKNGVLFCLKDLSETNFDEKLKANLLHPFSLVYIDREGNIQVPASRGK